MIYLGYIYIDQIKHGLCYSFYYCYDGIVSIKNKIYNYFYPRPEGPPGPNWSEDDHHNLPSSSDSPSTAGDTNQEIRRLMQTNYELRGEVGRLRLENPRVLNNMRAPDYQSFEHGDITNVIPKRPELPTASSNLPSSSGKDVE